jgi:Na+/proline symporter
MPDFHRKHRPLAIYHTAIIDICTLYTRRNTDTSKYSLAARDVTRLAAAAARVALDRDAREGPA